MAKKKKADPTESINETPAEGFTTVDCTNVSAATTPETRPIDEALSDIVAKQTDELKNEPVPVTEVKALSEEVLASLYNKHGLPREFNPAEPRWNIPSMKNRYALLLADIAVHEKL